MSVILSNGSQVMPNLVPPITTVQHALSYRSYLRGIEPNVTFLMSLYLHPSITPEIIREAKEAGITGVKSYPAGVRIIHLSHLMSHFQHSPPTLTMFPRLQPTLPPASSITRHFMPSSPRWKYRT